MNARFVPLDLKDFPSPRPAGSRKKSQFKTGWGKTLELLDYELQKLGARDVVIQAGFRPDQIRIDGWPYGKAVPSHAAIIVSFRDIEGAALSFPCDTFVTIDDNLRAIALSLEALRAVDRFGVTRRNEQYTGFKAIEAPKTGWTSVEEAACWLGHYAPNLDVLESAENYRQAYRSAAAQLHPDRLGANPHWWGLLQQAKSLLDQHFGLNAGRAL